MRYVSWIGLGWLGVVIWTALASRVELGHLVPDAAVVTIVFVSLRRDVITAVVSALVLGYLCGRQACAPIGVHETALVLSGVGVYLTSGSLKGQGAAFFAVVSALTLVGYHLALFLLLTLFRGHAGFASWSAALFFPNALATGILALISYPWMNRLERKLTPETREGLAWR